VNGARLGRRHRTKIRAGELWGSFTVSEINKGARLRAGRLIAVPERREEIGLRT